MQDRYAGDIGDYVKLGLLRLLPQGRSLGVAWWLTPNGAGNEDGRYTNYLQRCDEWRALDEPLFDGLRQIVAGERSVKRLQAAQLLSGAQYADERLDTRLVKNGQRRRQRGDWFGRVKATLAGCAVVFLDPDNGIEANGFDAEDVNSNKSVTLDELKALKCRGHALIVYHHQTRRLGGHLEEIDYLHARFREVGLEPSGALRSSPWSARVFFVLNATQADIAAVLTFADKWQEHCTWYPANLRAADQPLPRRQRNTARRKAAR